MNIALRSRRAFTLIELMVVILILAILAALVVPKVLSRTGDAKLSAAKSDLSALAGAGQQFQLDARRLPTTEEGLQALRVEPSGVQAWRGPYLNKDIPTDPWGNDYEYQTPGTAGRDSFVIRSFGSDGAEGGDGDAADIVDGSN